MYHIEDNCSFAGSSRAKGTGGVLKRIFLRSFLMQRFIYWPDPTYFVFSIAENCHQ